MSDRRRGLPFAFALFASLLVHVVGVPVVIAVALPDGVSKRASKEHSDPMEIVDLKRERRDRSDDEPPTDVAKKDDPVEEVPPPPDPELDGQLVELPPQRNPEKPEKADYLAETDHKVEKETRSVRFEVNPEVLSDRWSPEQRVEMAGEDVADLDMTRPSTGARVGGVAAPFDPRRDGMLAATPSKWKVTNRDGLADPVPSSSLVSVLAGAPQNDRLNEANGATTSLNTKEFLYAGYLTRIRRLVNFYWNQNVDNLPNSVKLVRPEYTTDVKVVLDSLGTLETIDVTEASGSVELDDAVVRAFKVAGPFSNPPAGLIGADGRIVLPDMGFTVTVGVAQMHFDGIDPRAGVQFPGILKAPR